MERAWLAQHLTTGSSSSSGGRTSGTSGSLRHAEGGGGAAAGASWREDVTGLALDLALLSIMAGGNDYLPGMQVGRGIH